MPRFRVRVRRGGAGTIVNGVTRGPGQVVLETDKAGAALACATQSLNLVVTAGLSDEEVPLESLRHEVLGDSVATKKAEAASAAAAEAILAAASPPVAAPGEPVVIPLSLLPGDEFPPVTVSMKGLTSFALKYGIQEAELAADGRKSRDARYAWLKGRFSAT